jgi:hypothetical protein
VDDRAALGDRGRTDRLGDVVPDPLGGTPGRLVRAVLVLADSDGEAALAGPYGRVADEAVDSSDELPDLDVSLLELVEELRSTFSGIAANDCVHHCLLETGRG